MAKMKKQGGNEIPTHILDDLCSRFVINSEGRYLDSIRFFYFSELAYWHYIDFYRMEQPELPKCNHKVLTKHIAAHLPELSHILSDFDDAYQTWVLHKRSIPSFGGILLSPDYQHVLLLQGYSSRTSWGFPKGKRENTESGLECAIREIHEETSIDVSDKILPDAHIECWFQDQYTRLYIIPGIKTDRSFQPKLRKEIKEYRWFPVEALPAYKNDPNTRQQIKMDANNFFKVIPFVKNLRRWIAQQLGQHQPVPASQFTAKGRRGKNKDAQRRQGPVGPHGDAPATRDQGQGQGQGRSQVARSLSDRFNELASGQTPKQGKGVQILTKKGVTGGGRKEQHHEADTKSGGKSKTRATDKSAGAGKLRLDEFHSKALLNFKFNIEPILDCLKW